MEVERRASPLDRFGRALIQAMRDRNVDMTAVARSIGTVDRQFSAWCAGTAEPAPAAVFDIEHVLGVAPGELSRHLGYVPVGQVGADRPLADVVERTNLLNDEEKQMVVGIIRVLVARHQMRLRVVSAPDVKGSGRRASVRRVAVGSTLEDLRTEWTTVLVSDGATRNTIENYRSAVEQLRLFLARVGRSIDGQAVQPSDIEEFMADLLLRNSPRTVTSRYRALRVFFAWAVELGEITVSPMAGVRAPVVPPHRDVGRAGPATPAPRVR